MREYLYYIAKKRLLSSHCNEPEVSFFIQEQEPRVLRTMFRFVASTDWEKLNVHFYSLKFRHKPFQYLQFIH